VTFLLLAAVIAIIVVGVMRAATPMAVALKPRTITLIGIALILGSFFFQDWLRFDFIQYLRVGWDPVRDLAPEAAGLFGLESLTPLLRIVLGAATLNGWQLALVPFLSLGTRAALLLPPLIALAALVWLPFGASYSGSLPCKIVGVLLAVVSMTALVGLTVAIPQVDALGVHDQIHWAMLAVLLGVRMELGPWLTLLGLGLLFVGGMVEIMAGSPVSREDRSQELTWP
jgi:hypothetical protein